MTKQNIEQTLKEGLKGLSCKQIKAVISEYKRIQHLAAMNCNTKDYIIILDGDRYYKAGRYKICTDMTAIGLSEDSYDDELIATKYYTTFSEISPINLEDFPHKNITWCLDISLAFAVYTRINEQRLTRGYSVDKFDMSWEPGDMTTQEQSVLLLLIDKKNILTVISLLQRMKNMEDHTAPQHEMDCYLDSMLKQASRRK